MSDTQTWFPGNQLAHLNPPEIHTSLDRLTPVYLSRQRRHTRLHLHLCPYIQLMFKLVHMFALKPSGASLAIFYTFLSIILMGVYSRSMVPSLMKHQEIKVFAIYPLGTVCAKFNDDPSNNCYIYII